MSFTVTPLVGVWIETARPCCLVAPRWVTPLVGVWIETFNENINGLHPIVTPLVGVWIETDTNWEGADEMKCHSPRGSVD